MAESQNNPGHGDSPAAWTTVIVILLAFVTGTLFFWFEMPAGVWASVLLALVGLILGWILKRAGYGVGGNRVSSSGR